MSTHKVLINNSQQKYLRRLLIFKSWNAILQEFNLKKTCKYEIFAVLES